MSVFGIAIMCLLPSIATAKGSWQGTTWQSPSGNIICHFDGESLQCGTRDTGRVATLTRSSVSREQLPLLPASLADKYGPILPYGRSWATADGAYKCLSTSTAMRCSNENGNGFALSRDTVDVVPASAPSTPPSSASSGTYPPLSLTQARRLTVKMANKWMQTEELPAWWYQAASCERLGAAKLECTLTVYRNAAATLPYVKLLIDVWNGQEAANGNYFNHEAVVDSTRFS
jgi:hypothetical protein